MGQETDDRKISAVKPSIWSYTSFKDGESRLLSKDRTELRIALTIERLGEELKLPISVKGEAVMLSRRILRAARGPRVKGEWRRLTVEDMAISSLVPACRLMSVPRAIKDFVKAGEKIGLEAKSHTLFKRLLKSVPASGIRHHRNRPEDYVGYLVNRLMNDEQVNSSVSKYVNPNEYARHLHKKAMEALSGIKMEGRSPWLIAASSICLADQVLASGRGLMGREQVSRIAGCGFSNINETLSLIKKSTRLELEAPEILFKLMIAAKRDRLKRTVLG
ncbi:MAG: hypothetical protein HY619_04140 [Thaumarchaeota archaeon]|nr:hypothetical protein [Nitrososphaerota archaeon]